MGLVDAVVEGTRPRSRFMSRRGGEWEPSHAGRRRISHGTGSRPAGTVWILQQDRRRLPTYSRPKRLVTPLRSSSSRVPLSVALLRATTVPRRQARQTMCHRGSPAVSRGSHPASRGGAPARSRRHCGPHRCRQYGMVPSWHRRSMRCPSQDGESRRAPTQVRKSTPDDAKPLARDMTGPPRCSCQGDRRPGGFRPLRPGHASLISTQGSRVPRTPRRGLVIEAS